MKGFFDIIFGGDSYEIIAKGGLAGSAVTALRLSGSIMDKAIKLIVGVLTAMFLGPFFIDIINIVTLKVWSFKLHGSSAIGAVGFIVGYLGVDGLSKLWIKLKMADILRRFFLYLLINKKDEDDN